MKHLKRVTTDPTIIPQREDLSLTLVEGPTDKNWLKDLPEGTVFFSRPKHTPPFAQDWVCTQYRITQQYLKVTSLWDIMGQEPECYFVVDSYLFSSQNTCVEILIYGKGNR
jgi:hypothetical protein